jgi:hypothetical protein
MIDINFFDKVEKVTFPDGGAIYRVYKDSVTKNVPEDHGNVDYQNVVEWAESGGVVDDVVIELSYADKRRREYNNNDYIDAIMKQMNSDRLAGKELVQDMDDALGHWNNVKKQNPKPTNQGE